MLLTIPLHPVKVKIDGLAPAHCTQIQKHTFQQLSRCSAFLPAGTLLAWLQGGLEAESRSLVRTERLNEELSHERLRLHLSIRSPHKGVKHAHIHTQWESQQKFHLYIKLKACLMTNASSPSPPCTCPLLPFPSSFPSSLSFPFPLIPICRQETRRRWWGVIKHRQHHVQQKGHYGGLMARFQSC